MIIKLWIFFAALLIFVSCDRAEKEKADATWFGGEIINPTQSFISLRKCDTLIANIPLDRNNRFIYKIEDFKSGLYEFSHKERQVVYLEPGDSVLIRVNTIDYDESLTFSGFGDSKNNILISLFLKNEKENTLMLRNGIYQKNPQSFEKYIDSLETDHLSWMDTLKSNHHYSEAFENLLNATIAYDLYARKEAYPLFKFTNSKSKFIATLPKDFYAYRKDLGFDHGEYLFLYAYKRFLINYFNQAAYKKYARENAYDNQSFVHNYNEISLIDSLVHNKSVKSFLLTRSLRSYLNHNSNQKNGETLYKEYIKNDPLPADLAAMKERYLAFTHISAGNKVPDEPLINTKSENINLYNLLNKPTILYFWSSQQKEHMKRADARAVALREHFPEYDVIGLNIDQDKNTWLQSLKYLRANTAYAYHFTETPDEVTQDLDISSIIKTIIVEKNGNILDAHATMFDQDFEEKLLGYLNNHNL